MEQFYLHQQVLILTLPQCCKIAYSQKMSDQSRGDVDYLLQVKTGQVSRLACPPQIPSPRVREALLIFPKLLLQ